MSLMDYLKDDPRQEIAWAATFVTSVVLLAMDKLDQWPFVVLVCVSLMTLLGAQYFGGVKAGPGGIEVKR